MTRIKHSIGVETDERVWFEMAMRSADDFADFYHDQVAIARTIKGRLTAQQKRSARVTAAALRLAEYEKIRMAKRDIANDARSQSHRRRKLIAQARHHHYRSNPTAKSPEPLQRAAAYDFSAFCWEHENGPCYWCGRNGKLTVDHLTPLSRGGMHTIDNLQAACTKCNCQKHNRTPEEYIAWLAERGLTPALDQTMKIRWKVTLPVLGQIGTAGL